MSLNHILYDIVPDNEKLDVKLANVYCDNVITGGSSGGSDGYVSSLGSALSSSTAGVSTLAIFNSAVSKNHSSFNWGFKSIVDFTANVNLYDLEITLPTDVVTYFDANPTAFATNFIAINGYSHTSTSSATYNPIDHYYASDVVKQSSTSIKITMRSYSNNATGAVPQSHNLHLSILFSGPA